jgi:hypothetical protein
MRYYCNCCGADWPAEENEDAVVCPECGAEYDPDDESIIEKYNASGGRAPSHSDDDLLCEAGDRIDNAVHAALSSLCVNELDWDLSLIGPATEALEALLVARGIPTCHPWENENGNICYSLSEERCAHCPKVGCA